MQYILSQVEYNELLQKKNVEFNIKKEKLQDLCTRVCNELPIIFWNNEYKKPWECKNTVDFEWYCDECIMREICPEDHKAWSK